MYSTHNEGKSVVAERFIRTLKNKNVYIDKLDDIVNEYNNTYHKTIKMKSTDVKDNSYINIGKRVNDKDPKFIIIINPKVGDHIGRSKYKNIFAKGYTPNSFEEIFVIKEIKITIPWTYVINDLNGEEVIGTFYEKELQKTNQEGFRIEKVIKKKGNKLYVKWKGYDNSFNIDKLTPVPNDLAKISNAVKNDVVKKTEYNKLVSKVNGIDTTNLFQETNTKKMGQI